MDQIRGWLIEIVVWKQVVQVIWIHLVYKCLSLDVLE